MNTASPPLLQIHDLCVDFPTRHGTVQAVRDFNLHLAPGEIHGIVGESGAGKSTVGAAVLGLLHAPGYLRAGRISLDGKTISGLDAEAMQQLRGKRISTVFQDPLTALNPLFTVREQLVETIQTHLPLATADANARALDLIERVGIPDPHTRLDQYPHQFSGGMRQRVVIALALCSEPDVIIADEPTTALDVAVQAQILDLIRDLVAERQVGVVLVTHDMGVIADTTDTVSVMRNGELVEQGPTAQVLGQPSHPYTQALIAAVPRPDVTTERFAQLQARQPLPVRRPTETATSGSADTSPAVVITAEALSKRFIDRQSLLPWRRRYFTAVDQVSFTVRRGEVFGLVGESGSGKSTLARMLCGLHPIDAGSLTISVGDGAAGARGPTAGRDIQMIFQDPFSSLNPRMRVGDIVAEPIHHHKLVSGAAVGERVADLLTHVGLERDAARAYPHAFSGGQRQRIAIARALATEPHILICDEPTSALDVSIQASVLNLLKDLRDAFGLTLVFISHDLPVVRQMCDRVAVMQEGQLVELQDTETLFRSPQHDYTQRLLSHMPKLTMLAKG